MKKTTVTPRATFDQIPNPNQSKKIGASTTRGSAFRIFMKGCERSLFQRDEKMRPDGSGPEPRQNASRDVSRAAEEEFVEFARRHQPLPREKKRHRDQNLAEQKRRFSAHKK
jgi:hypothetical protein